MNNLRWLTSLFNTRKPLQFGLLGNRRSNRGTLMWTLIGLIATLATASFYGARGRNANQMLKPIQNVANNVQHSVKDGVQRTNIRQFRTALAEFANELTPPKGPNMKNNTSNEKE